MDYSVFLNVEELDQIYLNVLNAMMNSVPLTNEKIVKL